MYYLLCLLLVSAIVKGESSGFGSLVAGSLSSNLHRFAGLRHCSLSSLTKALKLACEWKDSAHGLVAS